MELDRSAIVARVVMDEQVLPGSSPTNIGPKPMELSKDLVLDMPKVTQSSSSAFFLRDCALRQNKYTGEESGNCSNKG